MDKPRSINAIAREIHTDWNGRKPGINYAARPYLEAMFALDSIEDPYLCESGSAVVAYFLANAGTWRGETAKRVKLELKAMLKGAKR